MANTAMTTEGSVKTGSSLGWAFLSLTRISIGFVFLWAFFDKLLGLGYATCRDAETGTVDFMCDSAWLQGGHVTEGYLKSAAGEFGGEPAGVYGEMFKGWGDFAIGSFRPLDWVFMLALAGVGFAFMLGIGTKVGAWSAVGLLLMMYVAHFDNTNNPIIDDHIVYALASVGIVYVELQRQSIGLGRSWRSLPIVKKNSWLV
ncbi:hypothetical protein [Demequina sp.]|uniref:hypothetical protein n=1 Tax=Demequina sp. TaxID=2050685 RepID=UPI0025D38B66|nr:hypothetical protein [Demequina sp.]